MKKTLGLGIVLLIVLTACGDKEEFIIDEDDEIFSDTMGVTIILNSFYDSAETGHRDLEYLYNENAETDETETETEIGTVTKKRLPNKELLKILDEYIKEYNDVEGEHKQKMYEQVVKAVKLMPKYVELNNKDIRSPFPESEETEEFNSMYRELINKIRGLMLEKR